MAIYYRKNQMPEKNLFLITQKLWHPWNFVSYFSLDPVYIRSTSWEDGSGLGAAMVWWWDIMKMGSLRKQTKSCKTLFRVAVIEMEKEGIPWSVHGKYYFKRLLMNTCCIKLMVSQNKAEKLGYAGTIMAWLVGSQQFSDWIWGLVL